MLLVVFTLLLGVYRKEPNTFAIHPVPIATHIEPSEGALLIRGEDALVYSGGGYRISLRYVVTSPPQSVLELFREVHQYELALAKQNDFQHVWRVYYQESALSHKDWKLTDDPDGFIDDYDYYPRMEPSDIRLRVTRNREGLVQYFFQNTLEGSCQTIHIVRGKVVKIYGCDGAEKDRFEAAVNAILRQAADDSMNSSGHTQNNAGQ
ncbi:hypothetical protein [Thaumasiovibrio subtropicus]|uniref:hypothetical protein n=1 Tax=Thaumasiovibrio subtropicus TaxID=1891207 RepID=UPI00131CE4A2|nr:hypothetical protein [Thaumasiovibrio subtropicus]